MDPFKSYSSLSAGKKRFPSVIIRISSAFLTAVTTVSILPALIVPLEYKLNIGEPVQLSLQRKRVLSKEIKSSQRFTCNCNAATKIGEGT